MKPKSTQTLKNKLWKLVSEYTRRKDADWQGYVSCVTCGVRKHWKEMDAGHYIPRSAGMCTYFYEKNIHAQCNPCNRFKHGNLTQYALYLRRKYGDSILEELEAKRSMICKMGVLDYEMLIEEYKNKIKQL